MWSPLNPQPPPTKVLIFTLSLKSLALFYFVYVLHDAFKPLVLGLEPLFLDLVTALEHTLSICSAT